MNKASKLQTSVPAAPAPSDIVAVPNPAPVAPVDAAPDPKARSARFREAFALAVSLSSALGNDADARVLRTALDTLADSGGCSLSIVGPSVTMTLHGGIGASSAWRYLVGAKDASIGKAALSTDLRRKPEARRYSVR